MVGPCNGKFSNAQRGIYDVVYEAQDACVKLCVPGESMSTATAASNKAMMEGLYVSIPAFFLINRIWEMRVLRVRVRVRVRVRDLRT